MSLAELAVQVFKMAEHFFLDLSEPNFTQPRSTITSPTLYFIEVASLPCVPDGGVDGAGPHRRLRELGDCIVPVVLRVDDKDDGAAPLEDLFMVH